MDTEETHKLRVALQNLNLRSSLFGKEARLSWAELVQQAERAETSGQGRAGRNFWARVERAEIFVSGQRGRAPVEAVTAPGERASKIGFACELQTIQFEEALERLGFGARNTEDS